MTFNDAENQYSNGCRELDKLKSLLELMESAAIKADIDTSIPQPDWAGLLELALNQVGIAFNALRPLEEFLSHKRYEEFIAEQRNQDQDRTNENSAD